VPNLRIFNDCNAARTPLSTSGHQRSSAVLTKFFLLDSVEWQLLGRQIGSHFGSTRPQPAVRGCYPISMVWASCGSGEWLLFAEQIDVITASTQPTADGGEIEDFIIWATAVPPKTDLCPQRRVGCQDPVLTMPMSARRKCAGRKVKRRRRRCLRSIGDPFFGCSIVALCLAHGIVAFPYRRKSQTKLGSPGDDIHPWTAYRFISWRNRLETSEHASLKVSALCQMGMT